MPLRSTLHLFALSLLCLTLTACAPPSSAPPPSQPTAYSSGRPYEPSRRERERGGEQRQERSRPEPSGSQSFDFYLLNLSWSPEFCAIHPGKPECAQHLGFVLHGLWPQNNDGSYPQHCTGDPGPPDPSAFRDLYPDPGLLRHEWETHGTCSGLAPDTFFGDAREAMHEVAIPPQLTGLHQQISMPPATILDLFSAANPSIGRSSFALSCGNNYLTAIELCLGKDLHPIACPAVRSCRANSVRIPAP